MPLQCTGSPTIPHQNLNVAFLLRFCHRVFWVAFHFMLLIWKRATLGLGKKESEYNEVVEEAFTEQANIFAFNMSSVILGSQWPNMLSRQTLMFAGGWAPQSSQVCQCISFLAFSILNASSYFLNLDIPRGHIFLDCDGVSIFNSFCFISSHLNVLDWLSFWRARFSCQVGIPKFSQRCSCALLSERLWTVRTHNSYEWETVGGLPHFIPLDCWHC